MSATVKCNNFDCRFNSIHDGSRPKGNCTLEDIELDCTAECLTFEDVGAQPDSKEMED